MKLKPCPFCGGEAELVEGEYGMYLTGYAIYCKGTCGAKLGVTGRLCEAYEWIPYFDTEAEAIAAWNSRAERTCRNNKDKWSGLAKYLFVCSECGWNLVDVGNGAIDLSARLMKRCPMCGAKVMVE